MPKPSAAAAHRVIAVIGMHRSGTSLMARALQALGVALGDNLAAQPAPDNAKGHWEDRDVLAINREVLAALALQWELIGAADAAHLQAPSLEPLVERARALVRANTAGRSSWAFKDPRTSWLWPFWRRVLIDGGHFQPSFVWVIRHPRAVAQSLAHRDGFPSLKSHLLWLNHNLSPFEDVSAKSHVVVDYDRMLSRPQHELERIAAALRLGPVQGETVDAFIQEFLDAKLRHFTALGKAAPGIGAEQLAERAYKALLGVAGDGGTLRDAKFLAELRTIEREAVRFAGLAPRLDAASLVQNSATRLQSEIAARLREEVGGTLQEQVAATLRDQHEDTGRRLEAAGAHLQRQQEESQANLRRQQQEGQANLQEQVAATLRDQHEDIGRRLEAAGAHLQRQQEESQANLQEQVAATLREQHENTGRRLDEVQARIQQTEADLTTLTELLNQERYTVFKPLLRRAYRLGVALTLRLPGPVQRQLRRLKQRVLPRSAPLTLTVSRPAESVGAESAAGPPLGRPLADRFDMLVFPVIDWHFRFQRPQHLAKQLAQRGHRVFYLSTTFGIGTAPGFRVLDSPQANVFLIQLCFPGPQPLIYKDQLHGGPLDKLLAAMADLLARGALANLVAIVDLPFWRPLAQALPGCLVVYDCMDHHAGFSTNSRQMLKEEERLLTAADLVVTSSASLSETVRRGADNVLIRNASEIAHFSKAPERLAYPSERPVAGYLGAIADWFDIDLVAAAARRFEAWDFVLVGSMDHCDVSAVNQLDNVKLIGEVPYASAAGWVHSFDVALIPFQLNELTAHTNPVKVYEYLAAGKPVVATALPEVKLMNGMAHVAENAERFLELLPVAMAESGDATLAEKRRKWAAGHDWAARAEQLQQAIQGAFPKVSVIVLTYDNLAFTQACLHSLEANTQYPNWELLLVDNASTDGTREFLADYAARHPHARLIQNDANLGFAAGNNQGLKAAGGDYLIILNNDTYVTPGWMLDLIRHFRKTPDLGLVGPVTNNIGNEAKIDIHYEDMAQMQKAAWRYTSGHAGESLRVAAVAFFCAAMPRTVYETVGGLDERFGLGFFEDDDYCNRVREAGFSTAVAEDVFVHHHLSASFDQLDQERRQALFERNKALYEEKWGPWTAHQYRD